MVPSGAGSRITGGRLARIEPGLQLRIVPVHVLEKMDSLVLEQDGSVGDEDLNGLHQRNGRRCPGFHLATDARFVPSGHTRHRKAGQFDRLFDADAAMAEVAPVTREQVDRRRMVKVDVVPVGEHELDVAERVGRPRTLADAQRAGEHCVELRRRQHGVDAARSHELETFAAPVRRVPAKPRNHFVAADRGWHVPVRAEFDAAQTLVEEGRGMVHGLAHDDPHLLAHLDATIHDLVGAQHVLGDVDHDHAGAAHQRCPAKAFHRQRDLPRAL